MTDVGTEPCFGVAVSGRDGVWLNENRLGSAEQDFDDTLSKCHAFRFSEYQNEIILFSLES